MEYRYIARDITGREIEGRMEGESPSHVARLLREKGLFPVSIEPARAFRLRLDFSFGRVSLKDLVVFTRQLAAMVAAGIPLPSALDAIARQVRKRRFKDIIRDVREQVEGGVKFSDALRKYRGVFGDLYIALVEAGEATGELDLMLSRWVEFAERLLELRRKVINAMIYPTIVFVFAVLVLFVLLLKVVPTFEKLYSDARVELPGLTQFVVSASRFMREHFLFILGGLVAFLIAFRLALRLEQVRYYWDLLRLRFPVLGNLFRKVAVARFARTLSTMIKSGVSILEGIENVARTSGNKVVERTLISIKDDIAQGELLSSALSKSDLFPPVLLEMVSAGEKTGTLDSMLDKAADFFEEEVDVAVNAMTSLIEPLMLILVGGMVGTIVVALYLPIFKLASTVR